MLRHLESGLFVPCFAAGARLAFRRVRGPHLHPERRGRWPSAAAAQPAVYRFCLLQDGDAQPPGRLRRRRRGADQAARAGRGQPRRLKQTRAPSSRQLHEAEATCLSFSLPPSLPLFLPPRSRFLPTSVRCLS
eukprot:3179555-Pleurochrysis_carterae.AAC.2